MIQYKSVPGPVGLTVNTKEDYAYAVKQYAAIIDAEAVGGWNFELIRKVPVTKKAGCLASLFGKEDTTLYVNMLVFSKDDAEGVSSEGQPVEEINSLASQLTFEGTEVVSAENDKDSQAVNSDFEVSIPRGVAPEIQAPASGGDEPLPNDGKKKTAIIAAGAIAAAVVIGILIGKAIKPDIYDGPHYDSSLDYYVEEYDDAIEPVSNYDISNVTASSWLEEPEYEISHYPQLVTENRTETAWVEGTPGNGIGESITLHLNDKYTISGFEIMAGYWKSDSLYEKNSRPKELHVSFSDGTEYEISLEDVQKYQSFTFESPIVASEVTFTIKAVYPGSKYEDTAITYIRLF